MDSAVWISTLIYFILISHSFNNAGVEGKSKQVICCFNLYYIIWFILSCIWTCSKTSGLKKAFLFHKFWWTVRENLEPIQTSCIAHGYLNILTYILQKESELYHLKWLKGKVLPFWKIRSCWIKMYPRAMDKKVSFSILNR